MILAMLVMLSPVMQENRIVLAMLVMLSPGMRIITLMAEMNV